MISKKTLLILLIMTIFLTVPFAQAATGLVKYTYDDFYRLLKVENPDGSILNFTYDLMGNRKTMVTTGSTVGACLPPASGDWIISASCTYTGNVIAPANVIVQNNAVLTVANGASLNVNMTSFALRVKSGSGVLVKYGGKIY